MILRDLREYRDIIRIIRGWSGLTQKEFAEILGTSFQYYQKYESGVRPIPVDRLEVLADFYQTSTDYLLGRTAIREPYPKK